MNALVNSSRRSFLKGMAGILAAGVAPAAIGSGVLMPIKKLWTPPAFTRDTVATTLHNGRFIWITNNGLMAMTVSGVDLGDSYEPTPYPLEVHPGDSLAFSLDNKVWSRHMPNTSTIEWNDFGQLVP